MKLTTAEYRLLDSLELRAWSFIPRDLLKPSEKAMAKRMVAKGLLGKRAWFNSYVMATALGKRSYSYGKR